MIPTDTYMLLNKWLLMVREPDLKGRISNGYQILAMGDAGLWATAKLFENTLLGVLGPQGWQELFDE